MRHRAIDGLPVAIGWDPRQALAWEVARHSLLRHASIPVRPLRLVLDALRDAGLYTRPVWRTAAGGMYDPISAAPMATEFALTRFWLPWVVGGGERATDGWAVFCDCDVLWRADVARLLALADPRYAVMVVQHPEQQVATGERKMDDQPQSAYRRKNWSSVMLWNLSHPAHDRLTLATLNAWPGRDLHGFLWLEDDEIGALPAAWNWLEGHGDPAAVPAIVHYTRGGPWMAGWEDVAYAAAWRAEAARLAVAGP